MRVRVNTLLMIDCGVTAPMGVFGKDFNVFVILYYYTTKCALFEQMFCGFCVS